MVTKQLQKRFTIDDIYITFFCVGVVYSCEYDVASLKNMPGHGVDTHSE
jgi:hypothetical protein